MNLLVTDLLVAGEACLSRGRWPGSAERDGDRLRCPGAAQCGSGPGEFPGPDEHDRAAAPRVDTPCKPHPSHPRVDTPCKPHVLAPARHSRVTAPSPDPPPRDLPRDPPHLLRATCSTPTNMSVTAPWQSWGMTTGTPGLLEAAEAFLASAGSFEVESKTPEDCRLVAEAAARVQKAAGGLRVLAAAKALEGAAHKQAGFSDPAAWMARQGGTTRAAARQDLELARSLWTHFETKAALLSGAVSLEQAKEITRAEEDSPGQEHELVSLAGTRDLGELRDETRERKLSSISPEQLHRSQHDARGFRHWRDRLGMVRFEGALAPEIGVPLVSRVEKEAARRLREARAKGTKERFEAHAADALVALCSGDPKAQGAQRATSKDLVIVCDLSAWRRGHGHEGEVCHILGGGPIPVVLARKLADDAFLKAVVFDGVEIRTVRHFGRHLPAELKTALDLGPGPRFEGRACVDCKRRYGLEYDHLDPLAHNGPTSYDNLEARCYPCHKDKTERDREAGLLGQRASHRRSEHKGTGPKTKTAPSTPARATSQVQGTTSATTSQLRGTTSAATSQVQRAGSEPQGAEDLRARAPGPDPP